MIHYSSFRRVPKSLLLGLFCVVVSLSQAQVGVNWRLRNPKPWGDMLTSVAAINSSRVIATGRGTGLLLSTDAGVTWTASRVDFNAEFFTDAYVASSGGTRQVLVVGNRAFTSTAGEDWIEAATNLTGNDTLKFVIARGTGWAAIKQTMDPDTGNTVYSLVTAPTAGDIWTVVDVLPLVSTDFNTITALMLQGSTYIVAGTFSNNVMAHPQPILLQSFGGVGWTATTLNGASDSWGITSLANSGTVIIAAAEDNIYRSTDTGATWTRYPIASVPRVSWTGTRFVGAIGSLSRYSTDGITWTDSTTPYGPETPLAMIRVGNGVVAVGESGSIYSTTNGDVWVQRAPTGAKELLASIATNPAGIRLAFSPLNRIYRSTDGDNWSQQTGNATAAVWHGSQFVGVNRDSNYVSSADGITWTSSSVFGTDAMYAVASDGTTVVAVGDSGFGTAKAYYSNNPSVGWTEATVPIDAASLGAVTRSGSLWVAVGRNNTILTSPNGITWTQRNISGNAFDLRAVAGNSTGTLWVAFGLGGNGDYFTSTNGTTWTRRQLLDRQDVMGAVWTGSRFIVAANSNVALSSTDAINWTSITLPTNNYFTGMGWDPTRNEAYIFGDAGMMFTSDAVPEATFAAKSQGVFESTLNAAVQVNLTIAPTAPLTVPFTITGTAIDGTDYASFATTDVTFAAGETSKAINVTLVDDALSETDKTMIFTLGAATGVRVGQLPKHTLTILDNDGPPVVQFVGSEVSVPETVGTIGLQVTLTRPSPTAITVPISISGAAGSDLTPSASSVTIPAGASTAFLSVAVAPNASVTTDQLGTVTLGTPNVGTVGVNSTFSITVLDQDPASTPGRRWTLRQQQPSADTLWALTTIPGGPPRVVAVGDGGKVVTSDDSGATWTERFTNVTPDQQYNGVHWNGGFVIAAGSKGHIGTSQDGIGWSDQVVPGALSTTTFNSVASSLTRTVAVGSELVGNKEVPVIYSTPDSSHWSRVALPGGLIGDLRSVIYVSGTTSEFIAVGSHYDFDTDKAQTLILTSPNGLTWTNRSAALPGIDLSSVVAAGSTLVAFDGSKSAYSGVISPADGSITWTKRTLGTIGGLAYGAWTGSKLAAVGEATGTSTNGIAWVQKPSPAKNFLNDITWTGSKFVAVAYPNGIYTSTDGVLWTPPASAETWLNLMGVAWSGTQFCAVGGDFDRVKTALIYTSPDGVTWTPRASTLKVPLIAITWSGTQFCAVGANGTITTSPNGIAWTTRTSGTTLDLHDVIWATNQFVAVGGNETDEDNTIRLGGSILLTSKDGVAWTRRAIPTGHPLEGIAYNPNAPISFGPPVVVGPLFVAVGRSTFDGGQSEAEVLTSTDAVTWTHQSSGVLGTDFQRVTSTPNGYVATTGNFGIYVSNNGTSWSAATLPAAPATSYTNALHGITFAGGEVVAVGGSGSILTSPSGYTWTARQSHMRTGDFFGVAASPTTLVAVGANASIQTSPVAASAPAPVVNFAQATSTVSESGGSVSILVRLSSPPAVATSVVFHPTAGTGLVLTGTGADVTVPASPLVFNPGETTKYLTIGIKSDNVQESDETLTLILDSVTGGGATLGMGTNHTLTITNDDRVPQVIGFGAGIALEGSTVTLGAGVMTGSLPLTFLWKKNGAALPATVIDAKSPRLYFKSVTIADGGTYTCLVSNAAGSTTITLPLGVVRTNPTAIPYAGTTTATLTQPASSNIICHWFKDGSTTEVAAGPNFVFNANKSTLTVKSLASNTGSYACKVELPTFSMPPFGPGYTYTVTTTTAEPIIATNPTLPAGVIGTPYNYTMGLFFGSGVVNTWSSPDLASIGLSIDPLTGTITGMPSAVVTNKAVTIVATNGKASATVKPTITITSPIAAFVGTHTGLMDRNPSLNNNLGGIVTVVVNANGTCTGSYTVGTVKTSFNGHVFSVGPTGFNIQALIGGAAQQPIAKAGTGIATLFFNYESTRANQTGIGSIQIDPLTSAPSFAPIRTWRAITGAANIAPYIGRWNYALRLGTLADVGNQGLPQGHSFGSATIPASGVVSHAVKLSDGTSVTASSPVNVDGSSILYSLLYGGKGSLMAAPLIANAASVDSTITDLSASWNKFPDTTAAGARNYPAGWVPITLKLEGAKYKYVGGNHVMGLTVPTMYPFVNAKLTFAEGGTQATTPYADVHLNIKNDGTLDGPIYDLMTGYNPRLATFSITPTTGAISGRLDMNERLGNGVLTTKRGAIAYNGQIVRFTGGGPSALVAQGVGYILLPQLQNLNVSPVSAETATPILSGRVEVKPYP